MPYAMATLGLVPAPYRSRASRTSSWEPRSQVAGTKLTFQHSERQPWTVGLSAPPYLTARCKSARVEQLFRVASHLDLVGCQTRYSKGDAALRDSPSLGDGWHVQWVRSCEVMKAPRVRIDLQVDAEAAVFGGELPVLYM